MNNHYYEHTRKDIISIMLDYSAIENASLLDVGCASGQMGIIAKEKLSLRKVCGVEINKDQGDIAKRFYDKVFIGDIESDFNLLNDYFREKFDIIAFADVLEHLKDPWSVLEKTRELLNEGGIVIASIPNLAYWGALKKIILDKWIYTEAGILDKTHLRFFTKKTITDLFDKTGYIIKKVEVEKYPGKCKSVFNLVTFNYFNHIFIGKYLIVAKAKSD